MKQGNLFKIETAFQKYDRENPKIYSAFKAKSVKLIESGRDHYSARAIIEVIRYDTIISGNDEYKINNNHCRNYALKFIGEHPQYKDFFEIRKSN